MKWEETVINKEQRDKAAYKYNELYKGGIFEYTRKPDADEAMVKAQAEISFKAGFREALATVVATREYDEGKKAGRKEVVDWICSHQLIAPDKNSLTRFEPFYQIESKELGKWTT